MTIEYIRIRDIILKLQEIEQSEGNVRVFFMDSEYADTQIADITTTPMHDGEVVVFIN